MYIYNVHILLILLQVSIELGAHAERSPGFQINLREVRKRMVGQETSDLLRYIYMYIYIQHTTTQNPEATIFTGSHFHKKTRVFIEHVYTLCWCMHVHVHASRNTRSSLLILVGRANFCMNTTAQKEPRR